MTRAAATLRGLAAAPRSWSGYATTHGYYDQAHFIDEFRELVGQAPKRFLKKPRRAAPAGKAGGHSTHRFGLHSIKPVMRETGPRELGSHRIARLRSSRARPCLLQAALGARPAPGGSAGNRRVPFTPCGLAPSPSTGFAVVVGALTLATPAIRRSGPLRAASYDPRPRLPRTRHGARLPACQRGARSQRVAPRRGERLGESGRQQTPRFGGHFAQRSALSVAGMRTE
jgi:hypothetical protein